jgi:hypothetical protein
MGNFASKSVSHLQKRDTFQFQTEIDQLESQQSILMQQLSKEEEEFFKVQDLTPLVIEFK